MREQELFDYLKQGIYPDLVKSEGQFDGFDCISDKAGHFIELKCRHTHYDTLLIEEMKYRKLIDHAKERSLLPFYINSTPTGIFSFDLTGIAQPEWVTHKMPATSEFSNRTKVDKLVGYLDVKDAEQL